VAGWSGGWLEGDGVSEGFEPGDEPTGLPVGVLAAGEVVGTGRATFPLLRKRILLTS
jgi:hypothetical protein